MALLQYQITIYGICIERFMNPKWRLTKDDISVEEETLEIICQYFDQWLEDIIELKTNNNLKETVVGRYFISLITNNNMKTLPYVDVANGSQPGGWTWPMEVNQWK